MNELVNKYIKLIKKPRILIIAGVAGIALVLLSSLFTSEEKSITSQGNVITAEEYKAILEDDIRKTVEDITGSDNVSVIITLESSIRYSYADTREEIITQKEGERDKTSDNELKEGYITVKTSDGGEAALIVSTEMPKVRGVAIVCDGGDNEYICEKIKNAVMAALDITSKRVYICGRNT